MCTLDLFADHMIITHETYLDWLDVWRWITAFVVAGYDTMIKHPHLLDLKEVEEGWNQLRAALS